MLLRYKFRIYPNKEQEAKLRQFCGAARFAYNHFLQENKTKHNAEGKFIYYHEMCKLLTQLKKDPQYAWLYETSNQVLQQSLRDLDTALKNCFNHGRGFPCFKKKSHTSGSFRYAQDVKINGKVIRLPMVGWVKVKAHRTIPDFKSATVIMDGNRWYVSLVVDVQERPPISVNAITPDRIVGLDLGISSLVTTSDGQVIDNPRFLDKSLKKLKKQQRRLSRKKRGSKNYRKQQKKVYKIHQKIRNQRLDYLHQASSQITNDYDLICLEDLNVQGLMRNHSLARQIGQSGWSAFVSMLTYKAKLKGGCTVKIDRFAPSSKTCCMCGKKHDMPLSERVMTCSCGNNMDRDLLAAINIRKWGMKILSSGAGDTCLRSSRKTKGHPPEGENETSSVDEKKQESKINQLVD